MAKGEVFVDCRRTTIDCIGELMQQIAAGAITRSILLTGTATSSGAVGKISTEAGGDEISQ
ncbi:hypothetical protein [Mesorhizobium qingshengii]|uniref:hypothetical protein n=1 Tax=Mesorhizobium qingshengii TaxID=1165689 RepID=UPI000B89CD4D|nr:hypothetical protein [Mesorhizobium qingshengii]